MKCKAMLLAAAALSALAFAATASMASASHQPPLSGAAGHTFSATSNNTVTVFGSPNIVCKSTEEVPSITVHGEYTTDETGWVRYVFHGCRESSLNSTCTTAGSPSGTITTTTLPFHTTYINPADSKKTHERPGILLTAGAKTDQTPHVGTFSCVGGFVKITVGGNGILGTVEEPGIGEASNSMTINVSATAEGQEHDTTHTDDTTYGLHASLNGGEAAPVYLNLGSVSTSFAEGFEATTKTLTQE